MSRSRKDGRRGGNHHTSCGKEYWSRRYEGANGSCQSSHHRRKSRGQHSWKTLTHRHERRKVQQEIRDSVA